MRGVRRTSNVPPHATKPFVTSSLTGRWRAEASAWSASMRACHSAIRLKLGSTYTWTTTRGLLAVDGTDASLGGRVWAAAGCPATRTASRTPERVNCVAREHMPICHGSKPGAAESGSDDGNFHPHVVALLRFRVV